MLRLVSQRPCLLRWLPPRFRPALTRWGFLFLVTMARKPAPPAPASREWDRAATMAAACERICCGESLNEICAGADMPDRNQIYRWMAADPALRQQYLEACKARTYHYAEEIIEIADDSSRDATVDKDGNEQLNSEFVARSKVRIDARKWIMARMNRVDFGDKVTQEHTGPNGGPIQSETVTMTAEEAYKRMLDGSP